MLPPCLLEPAALGLRRCWQLSHRLRDRICPKSKAHMASTPGMRGVLEGHCGLLSGGSPLKCQPLTHDPKQTEDRGFHSTPLLLCYPGGAAPQEIGLAPGFKVLHLLGYLASRLRSTVGSVCFRLTQPGSLLPRLEKVGRSRQISQPAGWLLTMPSFPLGQEPEHCFTEPGTWLYPVPNSLLRCHAQALCTQWKPKQTIWFMERQKTLNQNPNKTSLHGIQRKPHLPLPRLLCEPEPLGPPNNF